MGASDSQERQLLAGYNTYDQHVDVVSAFEWLFTSNEVKDLPDTVRHFERFPQIRTPSGALSPDFTILFTDHSAIAAEVASIAVNDNSVERLCRQLASYDGLRSVPGSGGGLVEVSSIDVLYLVPMATGLSAIRRIIRERYLDEEHSYSPTKPPCIVQFARLDDAYSFQRLPDPDNGKLFDGTRSPTVGQYLDNDLHIRADNLAPVKVARAFINDPINPLYLATHLWSRTWPTRYGSSRDIVVNANQTAEDLRSQYGIGRTQDVRKALELLAKAGLAARQDGGDWVVAHRLLGRPGQRDVHRLIASRAVGRIRPLITSRHIRSSQTGQETLF